MDIDREKEKISTYMYHWSNGPTQLQGEGHGETQKYSDTVIDQRIRSHKIMDPHRYRLKDTDQYG